MDTTYRLIDLSDRENVGQTALSPDLAKLVPGELMREGRRLGIERTDWVEHFERLKPLRSVITEAEDEPGQWKIGV